MMKVLSIQQPWASVIVLGEKRIETRSWKTKYRGKLLIHSSKGFPKKHSKLLLEKPFCEVVPKDYKFPLGMIIAECKLVDCVKMIDWKLDKSHRAVSATLENGEIIKGKELEFGEYDPERYSWILENIKMLDKPIPAKGQLGLWNYDMEGIEKKNNEF